MKTLIIGIARPGSANNYVLNPDNKYISMCGTKPEVSFSIDCGQYDFIKQINGLRYDDADPSSSAGSIEFFQGLLTKLFQDLKYLEIDKDDLTPLHVRLVTSPFELAQLPFEFVLAPNEITNGEKIPLLAHPERKFTLTREVRQESESGYTWPSKPKILFAWAQPGGKEMSVPHEQHYEALKNILFAKARPKKDKPNPEPFLEDLLTEVQNASLESIKAKLEEAIKAGTPYTHLHILAHGGENTELGVTEFRLILCQDGTTDKPQKIKGENLAKAIVPADPKSAPVVVSLSVCDSGNTGNTIIPSGSLVYQLHTAGVPCVFASQFPLTQPGSVILVQTLYQNLIDACDPRIALYEARINLRKQSSHDWASLVAYARFPEDINEQLLKADLETAFDTMKVTKAWVDHVFKFWDKIEDANKETALTALEQRLTKSIDALSAFLDPADKKKSNLENADLRTEHLGLLASAYKRIAEYYFRLIEFYPAKKEKLTIQSKEALNRSKEFYYSGFDANPASHWNSIQYLSLKAVTEGSLKKDQKLWYTTELMAERDIDKSAGAKIWAWGTLAELYLLKLLFDNDTMGENETPPLAMAKDFMGKLAAAGKEYNEAKITTANQFDRYNNWWPILFPETFPGKLKAAAMEIRNLLPPLNEMI